MLKNEKKSLPLKIICHIDIYRLKKDMKKNKNNIKIIPRIWDKEIGIINLK
jgi:hypothetical protein